MPSYYYDSLLALMVLALVVLPGFWLMDRRSREWAYSKWPTSEWPTPEPTQTPIVKSVDADAVSLLDVNGAEFSQTEPVPEDDQSAFPLVSVDQAPPEIQLCLNHIQDTLGIPWKPTNWRAYAMYPAVLRLFWQRLKPATQTESFLADAIAITEQVYQDVNDWYQPEYRVSLNQIDLNQIDLNQIDLNRGAQRQIQRILDALSFGNSQLLIQQIALSKALAGEIVGEHGSSDVRRDPHPHRHPEMQLVGEQSVQNLSVEMQQTYRDIQHTLGTPLVSADYQALARWSAFLMAAWEDIKIWRDRPEYQLLQQSILQSAEKAASRLRPAVVIGEQEVRDSLNHPADFEQVQQTVELFTNILPELMIQDALFRIGLANLKPAALDDIVNSL
jgi:Halocarboxylic acid dehydrogenase DehI